MCYSNRERYGGLVLKQSTLEIAKLLRDETAKEYWEQDYTKITAEWRRLIRRIEALERAWAEAKAL